MSKKIDQLLDIFQGNAYPAMLDDLAKRLGVSADSIRRIGPGWVPVVPFAKGPNYRGWWATPERDVDGVPVGLALRSPGGVKVMYPGSRHGLVYEVNPDHRLGGRGYTPGPENWIRTMAAGLPCAVCGKPDGCLLSAENPADPKAVICRVKRSDRRMGMGYLHILKDEGRLGSASALADNGVPVLVVEGFSDTCAALDLGYDAVGRPSNLACLDSLAELVRGRDAIVIGENDAKPDGSEPGREGMVAAWQALRKTCRHVTMLMPPSHVKDLRAWVARFGLTREKFEEYHRENQVEGVEELVLPDGRPLTIARAYLQQTQRAAGRYILRRWGRAWWRYADGRYVEVPDEVYRAPIYQWSHNKLVEEPTARGESVRKPLHATVSVVSNVEEAMISETLVPGETIPCWINGRQGHDPRDLVVFSNGILHVPSFLDGKLADDYLLDPTPDLFTTSALPFAFDPTATCPRWLRFLRETLGADQDKIRLLREWFGYCLTLDTSLQKLMYLRGPSGAGKSVACNVLAALIGRDQVASTSFKDLCGDFGVQAMLGKALCIIPDVRVSAKTDVMRGLELLLNIAAGDPIQINRKYKDPIDRHRLMTRVMIAGNDFIDVPDHAGAMVRRLNVIEFTESFIGREDFDLESSLIAECPGIAVWALGGLRRLREQGRFTVPASSAQSLREWRQSNSPTAAFLEECTDTVASGEVLKDELWDAWCGWSAERRLAQVVKSRFYERIKANAPQASSDTYEKGGRKFSVFRGLALKKWAAKQYLGRPH